MGIFKRLVIKQSHFGIKLTEMDLKWHNPAEGFTKK